MYFALPTNEEKERLFSLRLQQFNGPVQAIKEYLNLTQTFSHADIENVCRMIMRKCILDGKRSYTKKEIELAVKKQKQLVQLRKSQYSD
jgi:AAA+ superfamily predicted ATPase